MTDYRPGPPGENLPVAVSPHNVQAPEFHSHSIDQHPPLQRPPRRAQRRRRSRRLLRLTIVAVCLALLASTGSYVWADSQLEHGVDLSELPDRPAPGNGTNYLIVGTDSREGLSQEARDQLNTGDASGSRTDSIHVVHSGAHGATMVSLPRDSWVDLPSFVRPLTGQQYKDQKNKMNAAYSLGGPDLLIRTVEQATGLRIDHYAEIGFAGFVNIVDAVGGVEQCVDRPIEDEKSGLDLTKGCHLLDGAEALSFVRQRKQEKDGDIGRSRNQQQFLSDLAGQAATRDNLMRPNRVVGALSAGLKGVTVDKGTGLVDLANMLRALQSASGKEQRVELPLSSIGLSTPKGSAVQWDKAKTDRLFESLRNDRPISASAVRGASTKPE